MLRQLTRAAVDLATDAFYSATSGLGHSTSKETAISFERAPDLSQQTIESLYHGDWLSRRIVELMPNHALRKPWAELEDKAVQDRFVELNYTSTRPKGHLITAAYCGRAHGGCGLLMGFRGSGASARTPVKIGGPGRLEWLDVVERPYWRILTRYTDANHPKHGQPELLEIQGLHPRSGLVVHESRVLWFGGDQSIGDRFYSENEGFWSESVLRAVYVELSRYGLTWATVARMFEEASIPVLKTAGLIDSLASDGGELVKLRMKLFNQGKSVANTIFLDADHSEEFTREGVEFDEIPELLAQIMLIISGAAEAPATVLFGMSPGGMNATGESDLQNFYHTVAVYRTTSLQPNIERLLSFIAGREIKLVFPPLAEPSPKEEAQVRLINAQADKAYVDMQGVEGREIVKRRVANESFGLKVTPKKKEDVEKMNAPTGRTPPNQASETTSESTTSNEPTPGGGDAKQSE